jgi:RimJ/RimL family protein N-acetyltransferase
MEKIIELTECMAAGEPERYDELLDWNKTEWTNINHEKKAYIVAEINSRIVGFIRIWHSPYINKWMDDGMIVVPEYQNKGIGYTLVLKAVELAARMGVSILYCHIPKDNAPSKRIHEKAGFVAVTDSYLNSYGEARNGVGFEYKLII